MRTCCPVCEGRGDYIASEPMGPLRYARCDFCGGTGVVVSEAFGNEPALGEAPRLDTFEYNNRTGSEGEGDADR